MLSRDEFLKPRPVRLEEVPCPELGGSVCVRVMRAGERDAFEARLQLLDKAARYQDFRARVAAATVCDPDGAPLFTDSDVPALSQLDGAALDRIFDVARRLNRFSEDDVKELAKNS
jgi:hypothetical protein